MLGLALASLASCQRVSETKERPAPVSPFTILAGSELKDIESGLKGDIHSATRLSLALSYPGTLDAVDRIAGGQFDSVSKEIRGYS